LTTFLNSVLNSLVLGIGIFILVPLVLVYDKIYKNARVFIKEIYMISPKEALRILKEGNARFVECSAEHPNRCDEARSSLVKEQKPIAAILSCSDSRVPVEIVFDAGLGDVFSIRTAGHVLSPVIMGSLEYAVKELGVKLVVILGHENCGAVKSALGTYKSEQYNDLSDNLKAILEHIYPVFDSLSCGCCEEEDISVDCAVHSNIEYQVKDLLEKDEYIAQKAKAGDIMVIGANYSLKTGLVDFFE